MDINALLSALGSNPAILNALSGIMSNPTPPTKAPSTSDSGLDPRLLSVLSGLIPQAAPKQSGAQCASTYDQRDREGCSDKGNIADTIHRMLGGKADCENRVRLLNALRPYLSEDRRCKLDLILKLLKIAELGQLSGILSSF